MIVLSKRKTHSLWFYESLLVLAAAIWGFATVVIKDSVETFPSHWLVALRFSLASCVFGLLFFKNIKAHCNKETLKAGLVVGIATGSTFILNTLGLTDTTASNSSFLTGVYVIITPFLTWIILRIKPHVYNIAASFICMLGIFCIALNGFEGLNLRMGDLITLLSALSVAFQVILTAKFAQNVNVLALTFWQFVVASSMACALAFLTQPFPIELMTNAHTLASLAYLGIAASCITLGLQNLGLAHVKPAPASLLLATEILFGTFFSLLLLGEVLTPNAWIGCFLICLSIVISEYLPEYLKKKRR